MQTLIHLFKYKNCDYLINLFSSLITTYFLKTGFKAAGYDFITAVPMHPVKLKMRGYNQSMLLAHALANYFKKPLKNGIIYQTKLRASQTRLKKEERAKNTNEMFTAEGDLTAKRIIVVDDMFTTGATAQGCSRALREKGAEYILVITLSKA
ncbi:MAG: ComF family protein [Candidatus Omnitrophota bacterium]|nr:MAG: ComF family protein [Candidatus Omnitrophota bacterium]